jgi:hypothetical protein
MRFYNQSHAAYCGVDLHARTMYLHILDDHGRTRFDKNLPARPDAFLDAIAPSGTASSSTPLGLDWPPRRRPDRGERLLCEPVDALPASCPCRELTPNGDSAEVVAVAPSPTGSRCRRAPPALLRSQADPAVLKGHGTARKRFWGAAPLRSSSRRPGQRGTGRTPYSCLVPPQRARPTPNLSGADWREEVKRVR